MQSFCLLLQAPESLPHQWAGMHLAAPAAHPGQRSDGPAAAAGPPAPAEQTQQPAAHTQTISAAVRPNSHKTSTALLPPGGETYGGDSPAAAAVCLHYSIRMDANLQQAADTDHPGRPALHAGRGEGLQLSTQGMKGLQPCMCSYLLQGSPAQLRLGPHLPVPAPETLPQGPQGEAPADQQQICKDSIYVAAV